MIKLYEYYKNNINENDYYYFVFNEKIVEYFMFENEFEYYDEQVIIKRFKSLTYPRNNISICEEMEFIMICYYLYNEQFFIEEFPNFLNRPSSLNDFSLELRSTILSNSSNVSYVSWASRREFANNLKIKKNSNCNIKVSDDLNELFKKISNRNADFIVMSKDEKLEEINNVIENILKKDNRWNEIDYYNEAFDFITNELIMRYRKKIHCFRHGSDNSLEERNAITDNQKDFLINYGITVCELLLNCLK